MTIRRALLAALFLASVARAQDTTRGVRIGLQYDPGTRPGVVVLPSRGAGADSIRAIVQRDLENGDRVNVITLDAASADQIARGTNSWPILAKLGAAASVQITPTPTGLHLAVYDVAKQVTALVRDYPAPPMTDMRAWRAAVHGLSDDLEESVTGTRGVSRTRVAFERDHRIWMVDSDGQGLTGVSNSSGLLGSPAWHPNGGRIAYSSINPWQIVTQDLSTGRTQVLAGGSGVYISPVFSPDGSNVVYAYGRDEGVDLYTVPSEGGTPHRLSVGHGTDNTSPSFSPDGRRIAFMSGRAGHPEIYTIDADGTNVELLTPLEFGENAFRATPDWSPNGQVVAFRSGNGSLAQVLLINLRDKSLKQLTSDGANEDPSWAPDGRHLVFVSTRSGSKQLWILDAETGRTRQLTRGAPVRNPAWSPRLTN
jgi:TolB protein